MDTPLTTRTINALHIEDLDPKRFEAMVCTLVQRNRRWLNFNHHGLMGVDGGIDIEAIEEQSDGSKRHWIFQCKRYKEITIKQMKETIDTLQSVPDFFVLVVSCLATKKMIADFISYAVEKGFKQDQAFVWTKAELEAQLIANHPDLLSFYFGINILNAQQQKADEVVRNIALKERMHTDLLIRAENYLAERDKSLLPPRDRFISPMILIRSIDDSSYPNINEDGYAHFSKVAPHSFYHNGLSVMMNYRISILVDPNNGRWESEESYQGVNKPKYNSKSGYVIGNIPYTNIITYDLLGDDYYNIPHIFCKYNFGNSPFESISYGFERNDYYYVLCDDLKGLE